MKKVFGLLIAVALIVGFTTITQANDEAPLALTDTQMAQIIAGRAHPADAIEGLDHPSDVADIMPEHVVGDLPTSGPAHQAIAAELKSRVTEYVPWHVRMNE